MGASSTGRRKSTMFKHGRPRAKGGIEVAPKYIFVTGGVVSSLGKGLAAASIGALLEARGYRVALQKMDPYINVDAGTMSPYQHGEVFVTDDGGETDLDLGRYERFTSSRVTRDHNVTTGKVYYSVIQKERRGDYLGRTVQVIPHITDEIKAKIALFCDVEEEAVITAKDVDSIYEVPLVFHREGLDEIIVKLLGLEPRRIDLSRWESVVRRVKSPRAETRIAVVGKYVELRDSYKSLVEALAHGGIANEARVDVQWVDAEHIERDGADAQFAGIHGSLAPGCFGDRGILGKIEAVRYARERRVPYLGICLGMQCAVIEYARNVCGLAGASSSEFDPAAPHLVIDLLPEQRRVADKGGTMRLGLYPIVLGEGSLA